VLRKINRKIALEKYPLFPIRFYNKETNDEEYHYPKKVYASYVLTIPTKTYKTRIKYIGLEIKKLLIHLNIDFLLFLNDVELAWLKKIIILPKLKMPLPT
jgi:hypothetical protein